MSKFHEQIKKLQKEQKENRNHAFKRSMQKIEKHSKELKNTLSGFSVLLSENKEDV